MNLCVYMSFKCDMRCSFCSVRNYDSPDIISDSDLIEKTRRFLKRFAGNSQITVLGGEPLMHPGKLKKLITAVRKESPCPIHVFSNGNRLESGMLDFFRENEAGLVLSLSEHNFIGKKKSAVLKRAAVSGAGASLVVTRNLLNGFSEILESIYSFGFRRIMWTPDITEEWRKDDLNILRKELLKIKKFYFELMRKKKEIYEIGNIYELINSFFHPDEKTGYCPNVILRPDGMFMPCDKAICAGKSLISRYLSADFSASSREMFFAEAERAGARVRNLLCPVGVYSYFRYCRGFKGRDLRRVIEGHAGMSALIGDFYSSLIATASGYKPFRKAHHIMGLC